MNSDSTAIIKDQEAMVLVAFAHQLVHAMCAIELDRKLHGLSATGRVVVAVWSYQASYHHPDATTRAMFESAIRAYPFAELLFFSLEERKGPLSAYRRISQRSQWLRQRLNALNVKHADFFYAHDASADHTAQAFMQTRLTNRNICYGDVPGFLYPGKRPLRRPLAFSMSYLKDVFWQSRASDIDEWYSATQAYTAIDFKEREHEESLPQLTQIPSSQLIHHIAHLKAALSDISIFENGVLDDNDSPPNVLLLGNFSKSRLMSKHHELLLYQHICNENIASGERILIKKHPGTTPAFIAKLLRALSNFQVEVFPPYIEDLPIELFTEISTRTLVLSVSSASALFSLLPESKVIHALTQQHICRLFYPAQRAYMLEANKKILIHARTALP